MQNRSNLICVDIDDTICTGNVEVEEPRPIPEAISAIQELMAGGWRIIFYTARSWHRHEETVRWLKEHVGGEPQVVCGKIGPRFYVGDEVLNPNQGWDTILSEIGKP